MARTEDQIKQRIREIIIEEMNVTNLISQGDPEQWVPLFIDTLTARIHELCIDEITFRRK